jgi:hypothetical protein
VTMSAFEGKADIDQALTSRPLLTQLRAQTGFRRCVSLSSQLTVREVLSARSLAFSTPVGQSRLLCSP